MNLVRAALCALFRMPSMGGAQDFPAGNDPFSGDCATALQEWRPWVKHGDSRAQFDLGLLSRHGLGVPQDFVTAPMWFNLAGANGNSDARDVRDRLTRPMPPAQITEVQGRARRCLEAGYRHGD